MARAGACTECGVKIDAGSHGPLPTLCADHKRLHRNARALRNWHRSHPNDQYLRAVCVDCGAWFAKSSQATTRVRCDECRKRHSVLSRRKYSQSHPEQKREYYRKNRDRLAPYLKAAKHRRRVLARASSERFSRTEIFERDGWVCHICMRPVDRTLPFPDKQSASLDHIIPVSRGGDHTRENVRLAHMGCNWSKGAR